MKKNIKIQKIQQRHILGNSAYFKIKEGKVL